MAYLRLTTQLVGLQFLFLFSLKLPLQLNAQHFNIRMYWPTNQHTIVIYWGKLVSIHQAIVINKCSILFNWLKAFLCCSEIKKKKHQYITGPIKIPYLVQCVWPILREYFMVFKLNYNMYLWINEHWFEFLNAVNRFLAFWTLIIFSSNKNCFIDHFYSNRNFLSDNSNWWTINGTSSSFQCWNFQMIWQNHSFVVN